jgi:hypothetical protein
MTVPASDALVEITKGSLDVALYAWPVSAAVVIPALIALTVGSPFRDPVFRSRLSLMLTTYAFPLAVVAVGTIFRYDGPSHPSWVEPPSWYGAVLWSVILMHALAVISAPILMKGVRLRSAALVLPGLWLSLSAGFVAAIVIAGVGP